MSCSIHRRTFYIIHSLDARHCCAFAIVLKIYDDFQYIFKFMLEKIHLYILKTMESHLILNMEWKHQSQNLIFATRLQQLTPCFKNVSARYIEYHLPVNAYLHILFGMFHSWTMTDMYISQIDLMTVKCHT